MSRSSELWSKAVALHHQHRLAEAIDLYGGLLTEDPHFLPAYGARGMALVALGRFGEALADFDRVVAAQPDQVDGWSGRGQALGGIERHAEAVSAFEQAARRGPVDMVTLCAWGENLSALGRYKEAVAPLEQAVALAPGAARPRYVLAVAWRALERFEDALACFQVLAEQHPDYAPAQLDLGKAFDALKRRESALAAYGRALAIDPGLTEAYFWQAPALIDLDREDEALVVCDQALAAAPRWQEMHVNRGAALAKLGRPREAMAALDRALQLKPGCPATEFARANLDLSLGDFERGLVGFEHRDALYKFGLDPGSAPQWRGEDLTGKTILVRWEQGLGDIIQFCRYLPLLVQRGGRVIFSCPTFLHALLRGLGEGIELAGPEHIPDRFDVFVALMSLPLGFGARLETIPARTPYLFAEPSRTLAWRERLGAEGFRVGVSWRGSPTGTRMGKAFHPARFAPLAAVPGVRLISLQKGAGEEDLSTLPPGMAIESLGEGFDSGQDAFLDTAAVMESLDLVITTDTALAHLAGALDRPVWTALKFVADWRWFRDRADTPWYRSMRLFRQPAAGDWDSVFEQMASELGERLARR